MVRVCVCVWERVEWGSIYVLAQMNSVSSTQDFICVLALPACAECQTDPNKTVWPPRWAPGWRLPVVADCLVCTEHGRASAVAGSFVAQTQPD